MDLRKHSVLLTALALAMVVVIAAVLVKLPQDDGNASETLNQLLPTGIPSAFGTTSAATTGEQNFNTISITGSGTASMQADEATITLGVQTEAESASEAIRLNAILMTDIIDAVQLLGVTEDDMKTVSYSVNPMYAKYDYNTIVGYRVVNMIAVKITEMESIGDVIDTAAENGANRIQGISFGLSEANRGELKTRAYLSALRNAEEKAYLIAETLNLTITGVLYVSESSYQPYQPYRGYAELLDMTEPSTPIIEGKLTVSVTVHVIYSFEQ